MAANRVPEGQYTETIYGMVRRRRGMSFLGVGVVVFKRCGCLFFFRSKKESFLKLYRSLTLNYRHTTR